MSRWKSYGLRVNEMIVHFLLRGLRQFVIDFIQFVLQHPKPQTRIVENVPSVAWWLAKAVERTPGWCCWGLYEGPSTLMVVTVAMKQRWNSRSGSGGWLSQSSLPLRKCLRKPCGPDGALAWLGPSWGLAPDPEKHNTDNIKHFSGENVSRA